MSKTKRVLSWCPNWTSRGKGGRWRKQIDGQMRYFGSGKSEKDTKGYRAAEKRYFEFLGKREATKTVEVRCRDATVSDICEKYVQTLEARYNRKEISAQYVDHARYLLQDFVDHIGQRATFASISELDIEDYRNHTLNLPISQYTLRRISQATARDRLKTVRALFRWSWKMHIIENLPRNSDDVAKIANAAQPEVLTYTLEELGTLWDNASNRTRCYMALALNCGYGQKDISELRMGEINWQGKYIERDRSKTGIRARHKLWAITLQLLKENCNVKAKADERVFTNKNGLPLARTKIVDGRLKKSNAISNAFFRVRQKTGINEGRSFYSLRKTGASLIEQIDPAVTEMYLSHAENGMKKVYTRRDWTRLGKALTVMEERLKQVVSVRNGAGA
jgi:integrase